MYDSTYAPNKPNADLAELGDRINHVGIHSIRLSTATVLGWIGAMKFTAYEAGAIEGLVVSSPLTSWLYQVFSLQGASNLIGTTEIVTALLLLWGFKSPRAALIGAIGAVLTFLVTSSLLLTAPVTEPSLGGFPALSVVPGQFLLKDIVLLAAAVFLTGDALKRMARKK
ncbi:YkgB family protein [Yoonia sp. 2307UL14-13]|uniref:YkgB family protein n=1 Tax=Yoonia sp. 2307UL14-13 TaxID=3126506 RepID=UPI0030A68A9C